MYRFSIVNVREKKVPYGASFRSKFPRELTFEIFFLVLQERYGTVKECPEVPAQASSVKSQVLGLTLKSLFCSEF